MAEEQPPLPPDVTGPPGSPAPPGPLWPTADPPDVAPPSANAPPPPPPPPPAPGAPAAAPVAPPIAPAPMASTATPPVGALTPAAYRQPSVSELTKPSRGRRVGLIFLIVGLIVVIGGAAAGILLTRSTGSKASHLGASSPSASAAGGSPTASTPNTVAYTDPDQYYTAQFSKTPAYHSTTQASPVGNVPYRYAEYIGPDVDQLVGVLAFTPGTGFDTQKGLQGIASAGKGSVVSSAPSTFQGYPSLEGVISLQGDYLKVEIVHVGNLAYIIGTAGPVNPPADYAGFIAGVHITPH